MQKHNWVVDPGAHMDGCVITDAVSKEPSHNFNGTNMNNDVSGYLQAFCAWFQCEMLLLIIKTSA